MNTRVSAVKIDGSCIDLVLMASTKELSIWWKWLQNQSLKIQNGTAKFFQLPKKTDDFRAASKSNYYYATGCRYRKKATGPPEGNPPEGGFRWHSRA